MFNVHQEMPSGAKSRGLDATTEEMAQKHFDRMVSQVKLLENSNENVVMELDGKEILREHIQHAAW